MNKKRETGRGGGRGEYRLSCGLDSGGRTVGDVIWDVSWDCPSFQSMTGGFPVPPASVVESWCKRGRITRLTDEKRMTWGGNNIKTETLVDR